MVPTASLETTAALIRGQIAIDRLRGRLFGAVLFRDVAWRMLLDLALAHCEGRRRRFTALAMVEGTPPTTGRAAIFQLERRQLIVLERCTVDRRLIYTRLSPSAWMAMLDWLRAVGPATSPAASLALAQRRVREAALFADDRLRQTDLEDFLAAAAAPGTGHRPEATSRPVLDAPAAPPACVSATPGRPSRRADPADRRGARGRQPETASP